MSITSAEFTTKYTPTWCPGCGNFGIWLALKEAFARIGVGPSDGLVVYGVGCHGNMYDWMNMYGFVGLHGRTLPVAQGAKLANHKLPIVVVSGDGDGLGEGGNHFLHAAKRNPDLTVMLHDNQLYSLTTGQASPTAKPGFKTKSTPDGVFDAPINPLILSIAAGATFVARAFSGDTPGLIALMVEAINHKGFAVLDIMQPCVTFDKEHTYDWYRQRLYKLETEGYVPDNKMKAIERAMEWGDKIPYGIFYKEIRPTSEDHEPALVAGPLAKQPVGTVNLDDVLNEFI
jgi:2-oxoglutarate/2-oxoacid ferredoxin oxidoreductase subunit beta